MADQIVKNSAMIGQHTRKTVQSSNYTATGIQTYVPSIWWESHSEWQPVREQNMSIGQYDFHCVLFQMSWHELFFSLC
jgi:hypothetical protein